MGDVRKFKYDLSKFGASVPAVMSQLIRRGALIIMGDLVKGSPVDTGRFRASWFVGIGTPNREVGPERNGPGGAAEESLARLTALTPENVTGKDPVYISNNLAYGPSLADGSSKQAPSGWIAAAVDRAQREIDAVEFT